MSGEADHATDFSFLSKELEIIEDVSGNPTLTLDSPLVHVQCRVPVSASGSTLHNAQGTAFLFFSTAQALRQKAILYFCDAGDM